MDVSDENDESDGWVYFISLVGGLDGYRVFDGICDAGVFGNCSLPSIPFVLVWRKMSLGNGCCDGEDCFLLLMWVGSKFLR